MAINLKHIDQIMIYWEKQFRTNDNDLLEQYIGFYEIFVLNCKNSYQFIAYFVGSVSTLIETFSKNSAFISFIVGFVILMIQTFKDIMCRYLVPINSILQKYDIKV